MTEQTVEQRLKAADLRVTAPRLAVLRVLEHLDHADVDTIAGAVRERHRSVSTQAVYDVLRVLTSRGLTRRIEPSGSPARYEIRVGDNHHHVVCRVCGSISDIDCVVGETPCLEPSDAHGFTVDEAEVVFWGVCPACRESRARRPDSRTSLHTGTETHTEKELA